MKTPKSIHNYLKYSLLILVLGSLTSCYEHQGSGYYYIFPDDTHLVVYEGKLVGFPYEVEDALDHPKSGYQYKLIHITSSDYIGSPLLSLYDNPIFYDLRSQGGWNNWKEQIKLGKNYDMSLKDSSYIREVEDGNTTLAYNEVYRFLTKEDLTGAPAYLHLVLDSIKEYFTGEIFYQKVKKWEVDKIEDLNGLDITNDPDWKCYNDNIYSFTKSGKVKYEPGLDICDTDQVLEDKGLQEIYLTYSIETPDFVSFDSPGKMILEIQVPEPAKEFVEDFSFEIIASDFDASQFRITKSTGESADLLLVPSP